MLNVERSFFSQLSNLNAGIRGTPCFSAKAVRAVLLQPAVQVLRHERIIVQVGIGPVHAVDLCALAGRERVVLIQRPEAL